MKYISSSAIQIAFEELRKFHPVLGIDFFVMKRAGLPIGTTTTYDATKQANSFLKDHFRPIARSEQFVRLFSYNRDVSKNWLDRRYASSGLQSSRTRELRDAFIHETNTAIWGFSPDYIDAFLAYMPKADDGSIIKFPIFWMAAWVYKDEPLNDNISVYDLIQVFISEYGLIEKELVSLFTTEIDRSHFKIDLFSNYPIDEDFYLGLLGPPKDVAVEERGQISSIQLRNIGLIDVLSANFAKRFNLITGDNGLGKTIILDCAWWAMTEDWPSTPARSLKESRESPEISYNINGKQAFGLIDNQNGEWVNKGDSITRSGLAIYMSFDGSVHIYDSEQTKLKSLYMTQSQIWSGFQQQAGRDFSEAVSNGIMTDVPRWLRNGNNEIKLINKVLEKLSPDSDFTYQISESLTDPETNIIIPLLSHKLGTVPLNFSPAGIKKIISLAYILVWSLQRHNASRRKRGAERTSSITIMVDEIETHLHPKWQKSIARSLISLTSVLDKNLEAQFLISTHSPLVSVGLEPHFDASQDKLFNFEIIDSRLQFLEEQFYIRGNVNSTLVTLFDLDSPESDESYALRKAVIEQMNQDTADNNILSVTKAMEKLIPPTDPLWVQWRFYLMEKGISP